MLIIMIIILITIIPNAKTKKGLYTLILTKGANINASNSYNYINSRHANHNTNTCNEVKNFSYTYLWYGEC